MLTPANIKIYAGASDKRVLYRHGAGGMMDGVFKVGEYPDVAGISK